MVDCRAGSKARNARCVVGIRVMIEDEVLAVKTVREIKSRVSRKGYAV